MFKKKDSFIWFTILFSLFFLSSAFLYKLETPSRTFQNLAKDRLISQTKDNSLLTHFTFKNPQKFGLADTISLPIYNQTQQKEATLQDKNDLNSLQNLDFSKNRNSYSKQLLCNSLIFSIKHNLTQDSYPYFEEPFSVQSGVQNELPILLTEYTFSSKKDMDNYLSILCLIPDYLGGLCQYETEKANKSLFMSDASADSVIQTFDSFCKLPDIKNPYLTSFQNRAKQLYVNHKITQEEYSHYINENERIIKTIVFPAYQKTADTITLLKRGDHSTPCGLFFYPDGKNYYENLICSYLGEDIPITSLKNEFCRKLQSDYTELGTLLSSHTDYFMSVMGQEEKYDPLLNLSPNECLDYLKKEIGPDFGVVEDQNYPYTVKDVDSAMEPYTNPAYYFTPPTDDLSQNIIYINHSQTPKGIALFTTLAHEGFPGHLYQSVSSSKSLTRSFLPAISSITYFGSYIEGYATYAEFLSYKYAKKVARELSQNDLSSLYYDYIMYQRRISLNLYAILDIMIHYEGATKDDIAPFLKRIGISESQQIQEIHDYIASEPGTYVKYFGGYMKFLECQNLAKDVWGDAYNDQAFHSLILRLGPIDFLSLKSEILNFRIEATNIFNQD